MKLSDFKLGMKVVKVGGAGKGTIAVVSAIGPGGITVLVTKNRCHDYYWDKELFIRNNPENWEPVVTQFRNK